MDLEIPFSFQIVSVRSQNFAYTANKTDQRVKQLQHVSDSQDLVVSVKFSSRLLDSKTFPVEGRVVEMHTMKP